MHKCWRLRLKALSFTFSFICLFSHTHTVLVFSFFLLCILLNKLSSKKCQNFLLAVYDILYFTFFIPAIASIPLKILFYQRVFLFALLCLCCCCCCCSYCVPCLFCYSCYHIVNHCFCRIHATKHWHHTFTVSMFLCYHQLLCNI